MTEPIEPAVNTGESITAAEPPAGRSRLLSRLVGLALVISSVVLATYLLVAYFAFESGQAARVAQETTARDEQVPRQIELARQNPSLIPIPEPTRPYPLSYSVFRL